MASSNGLVCSAPSCSDGLLSPSLGEVSVDCGGDNACPRCTPGKACQVGSDCDSGRCLTNVCAAPTCDDTIMNQDEVATDCGGLNCPACGDGSRCIADSDCLSSICLVDAEDASQNVCLPASCEDGKKNGAESDSDCGHVCTNKCATGAHCLQDSDCISFKCDLDVNVCSASTASDGRKNSLETDVDCGGNVALMQYSSPRCRVGKRCEDHSDCESSHCDTSGSNVCLRATCDDGIFNGDETDTDCGGPHCDRCQDEALCITGGDCLSGLCRHYIVSSCAAATCSDGVLNQDESSVDCGGVCGATCQQGATCTHASYCLSNICSSSICVAGSCTDGVFQSGTESDVDCGKDCAPCVTGRNCGEASDCASSVCSNGQCAMASCTDGVLNQDETCVDGGGSICSKCGTGQGCVSSDSCISGACNAQTNTCEDASCSDGILNGDEGCIDGGRTCPDQCLVNDSCSSHDDCVSLRCESAMCLPANCEDGVKNQDETCIDGGGTICASRCVVAASCSQGSDCVSGSCSEKTGICLAATCTDSIKVPTTTACDLLYICVMSSL